MYLFNIIYCLILLYYFFYHVPKYDEAHELTNYFFGILYYVADITIFYSCLEIESLQVAFRQKNDEDVYSILYFFDLKSSILFK